MRVEGSIINAGAIRFTVPRAETGGVVLFVGADCTLSGGGRISLGDSKGFIEGAGGATTLTNLDNVITGGGEIGAGSLSLVNGKAGVIDAFLGSLTIDAGAFGPGQRRPARGQRRRQADHPRAQEHRDHRGLRRPCDRQRAGDRVRLGDRQGRRPHLFFQLQPGRDFRRPHRLSGTGPIPGVRRPHRRLFEVRRTSLDLSDIAFTGPGEASFSGGKTSGVLTVSDGTNTARLRLTGDYRNIVFTASDDGGGGVFITASGPVLTNSWRNAVDGSFDTASDWSLGVTPGMGQTADLAADGGGAYTVTASNDETVNSLQTAANATLSIASGTFTATDGTGAGVNAGTIDIANNGPLFEIFVVRGTLDNTGAVVLEGADSAALGLRHQLTGGGADLDGGEILGPSTAVTLTNVDNTISGSGRIGATSLTLVNQAAGVIDANGTSDLTIDTGASAIVNAGLLEATNQATLRVGAVANDGVIEADGGGVIVSGPVTGSGSAVINVAFLQFLSGFSQNVTFAGASGILELDQSQGFGASITGFSKSGGTLLDLKDIGFTGAGEASFSGTKASGVLTVSDGTHAAHTFLSAFPHTLSPPHRHPQGGTLQTYLAPPPAFPPLTAPFGPLGAAGCPRPGPPPGRGRGALGALSAAPTRL